MPDRIMHAAPRSIRLLWVAFVLGACQHGTDAGMIDLAEAMVPPQSEILEVVDNGVGLTIEVGDYCAALNISDGGVDVSVRTKKEPVDGHIRIQRLGDGNPWPPECRGNDVKAGGVPVGGSTVWPP